MLYSTTATTRVRRQHEREQQHTPVWLGPIHGMLLVRTNPQQPHSILTYTLWRQLGSRERKPAFYTALIQTWTSSEQMTEEGQHPVRTHSFTSALLPGGERKTVSRDANFHVSMTREITFVSRFRCWRPATWCLSDSHSTRPDDEQTLLLWSRETNKALLLSANRRVSLRSWDPSQFSDSATALPFVILVAEPLWFHSSDLNQENFLKTLPPDCRTDFAKMTVGRMVCQLTLNLDRGKPVSSLIS